LKNPFKKTHHFVGFVVRGGRRREGQTEKLRCELAIYGLSLADGRIDYVAVFGPRTDVVLEVAFG